LKPEEVATRLPHIFIAGDACHTHSPKAGQGMNVSMQDAFNIGWKLAAVLQGRSPPTLLHTYSAERQAVAQELIDFDREWAAMLSDRKGNDPAAVQKYFVQHGRYTAGTATRYQRVRDPLLKGESLTGESTHQHLAPGFLIGTRFHSAPVVRMGDGKLVQLGSTLLADGRWRLIAFAGAGDKAGADSAVGKLCTALTMSPQSLINSFTPSGADIDAVFDVRAVFQQSHHALAVTDLPLLLFPSKGKLGLRDYEKAFCALPDSRNVYALRGINREQGCLVVVRPDQYISQVLTLEDTDTLEQFFASFMHRARDR
jgi:phenol 2-monooxygenase